jgi:peptidoglycan/xylan/chitin deacetylase (PgdA/CDA1 family)
LKKLVLTATTILAFATILSAQAIVKKEASKTAPVANPPLFIVLGSDDNTKANGIAWMDSVLNSGTNKDGSKRYMSFYVNTDQNGAIWDGKNDLVDAAYNAYKAGHEIGNHTSTHLYIVEFGSMENGVDKGKRASKETIKAEIERVQNVLVSAGIPKEHQLGFRTPYLRYSDSVFTVLQETGFLYDCSVNAATTNTSRDNNFPYTLDFDDGNGNFSPDNSADVNDWGKTSKIGKHEGLWELPCVRFAIDPQDIEYVKGVLKSKYPNEDFDDYGGYVTGLDYNMWNEIQLNADQTVRSWLHTVKESLAGNRAPVTIGIHSQYYFEAKNSEFPKIPQEKRREAFEKFVEEASKLEGVFFISGDMLVRWMQNPVSAAEFNPENYKRPPFTQKTAPTKIRLSNNSVDAGILEIGNLTAVNLNSSLTHTFSVVEGADNFEIANGNVLKLKSELSPNTTTSNNKGYNVSVRAEASENAGSVESSFTVWVDEVFNNDVDFAKRTWRG